MIGKARRMPMGSLIRNSTRRWGKPTTGGRACRKHSARKGNLCRTLSDRINTNQPPCGGRRRTGVSTAEVEKYEAAKFAVGDV
jgi:hypothetical protein